MNNSRKLFDDEITNWLIYEAGFKQSQFLIYIYIYIYTYALDGSKLVVSDYVDDCIYWYTYEELGKWFLDKLGNIFHVNFLGYEHWLCTFEYHNSINIIYQWTSLVMIHLLLQSIYTLPQLKKSKFHKATLPQDIILIR